MPRRQRNPHSAKSIARVKLMPYEIPCSNSRRYDLPRMAKIHGENLPRIARAARVLLAIGLRRRYDPVKASFKRGGAAL
jgi:hypothetical protein